MTTVWYCKVVTLASKDVKEKMDDKNVTNADLLAFMKEMKIGNDNLRRDIKNDMEIQNNAVKDEIKNLSKKVDKAKEDFEDKNKKKDNMNIAKMNERMNKIENEITKTIEEKRKREMIVKKAEENEKRKRDAEEYAKKEEIARERKEKEYASKLRKPTTQQNDYVSLNRTSSYHSDWAKEVEEDLNKEYMDANAKAERERIGKEKAEKTKEIKVREEKMRKDRERTEREKREKELTKETEDKDNFIGNSNILHEEEDWSWEDSEEDWDGMMDRKKKNKEKKKLRYMKRKQIQLETTRSGSLIVGIHPIKMESIDIFFRDTKNYEEAKILAAREYLESILQFSEDEMNAVRINDTLLSRKGDNVMYIAVDSHNTVAEIHRRIAERSNPQIFARLYIPPQYFDRFCAMSKLCKDIRGANPNIKTQIRFNSTDLEILTKVRGKDEPFKTYKPSEEELSEIPNFDFTKKWTKKVDRPPRRRLDPLLGSIEVPSLRNSRHPAKRQQSSSSSSSSSDEERESSSKRINRMDKGIDNSEKMETDKPSKRHKSNDKPNKGQEVMMENEDKSL